MLVYCALAALAVSVHGEIPASAIDFNRDVRPILSRNCFSCHGSDEKHRSAGLPLDIRDEALKLRKKNRTAIVPNKPEASELVRRITASDLGERMPPEESGHHLNKEQIATLERWI